MNTRISETGNRVTGYVTERSPASFHRGESHSRIASTECANLGAPMGNGGDDRRGAFHLKHNAKRKAVGRTGRRKCEGESARLASRHYSSPRLTLATVETVVREKYYYPGKSGGVPSRCQIGHVRMETRGESFSAPPPGCDSAGS